MRVYYFTSEKHAVSNLENRRIKIATINDLNDPFELMGLKLANKDYRKLFRQKRSEFAKAFGILCFCISWHSPVLWSHYGEKHAGICLGFDVTDKLLKEVKYITSMRIMESQIYALQSQIDMELMVELLYFKFLDWKYEKEIRLLVKLEECEKENSLYFLPFSNDIIIKKVIIGARGEKVPKDIGKLIKPNYTGVEIIKSRLAFQSYQVIQNKQYKIVNI